MPLLISSMKWLKAQWSTSVRSKHQIKGSIPLITNFTLHIDIIIFYKKRQTPFNFHSLVLSASHFCF